MKKIVLLSLIIIFSSCKNSKKEAFNKQIDFYAKKEQEHPGKKLMETYCYACHDAITAEDKRIAPPMIAIKRRYIFKDTSKDEFLNNMQNWIKNPNEKDAKMFGAVRRFGVMQKLPYPEEAIKEIADYMFDYDIEQPEWFEEHFNGMRGNNY